MNRKRETIFMGLGILAGLALSGPASAAVQQFTATPSTQTIYVDGQRVDMTAYSIGGNNYVRLRDIGKAVDFGVTYDAATNSVHIDSTQPYWEGTSTVPSAPTEESVRPPWHSSGKPIPPGQCTPRPTAPPAAGPTTGEPTAPAGLRCVRTPRLETSRGRGWTTQAGIRSAPAT